MEKRSLTIVKCIDGTIENVFDAWIDPMRVAEWYGPENMINEIQEMNAVEGGAYRLVMKAPDGSTHPLHGVFKTVERPNKLVMTWQWENMNEKTHTTPAETSVTTCFKGIGDVQTEVRMTHEGFEDEEAQKSHEAGWNEAFARLARLFG